MAAKKFSPEEIKHLEFIQDTMVRMNTNSFQIKGSAVTFISASLLSSTQNRIFILVAIIPTVIFWFLDTYYLWQERKFRALYNDVAGITKNREIKLFSMRPDLYTEGQYSFWDVFGSITIIMLYLPVIIILLGIYFVL